MKEINFRKPLTKTAMFTDIHFGRRANENLHNQDCLDYIQWFCSQVKSDPDIDSVVFMGDWFENRSAVNVSTLRYAYHGASMLNRLGIPIFFVVGNHDLYHRHTREVYSTVNFHEFDNFFVIDEPTIVEALGPGGSLICPFLFYDEYPKLVAYKHIKTWFGHFEFRNFIITGHSITMPTGPTHNDFKGPEFIFSGHYHKRQANDQVVYIGNAFPMDFSDAGDDQRGLCTIDHKTRWVDFENWDDCPRYIKTSLSMVLQGKVKLRKNARVKCVVDVNIDFEESNYIRQKFIEAYQLRQFSLEESNELLEALQDTKTDVDVNDDVLSVDELVVQMLGNIKADQIDNKMLVTIYNGLRAKE